MRRFILVREEGGLIEEMSRRQLEAAVAAMDRPPCAIGVTWGVKFLWGPAPFQGDLRRYAIVQGVLFDFILHRRNRIGGRRWINPWRAVGAGARFKPTNREWRRACDKALQQVLRAALRRFDL